MNSPDYQVVNVSPEKLQHDLLVELQGDPSDLKSQAWYHGNIARQHAEKLVIKNGDFLVRDCISQPGDFVLSCCWKGGPLHFVINSTVTDQGAGRLPKVTYHFEDIHFPSVQKLIQSYMEECKQITEITGAVITTPIARTMPLSYYDSKFAGQGSQAGCHYATVQSRPSGAHPPMRFQPGAHNGSPMSSPKPSPNGTPKSSPSGSPNSQRRGPVPRVERAGSQPLLSLNDLPMGMMDRSDSLPIMSGLLRQTQPPGYDTLPPGDTGIYKVIMPSTPPATSSSDMHHNPPHFFHQRSGSAPILTPGVMVTQHFDYLAPPTQLGPASSEGDLHKAPPPKPSRIPSVKYKQKPQVVVRNRQLYDDDDRDYSDYGMVKSEPSWLQQSANKNAQTVSSSQSSVKDVNQNVPKNDRVSDPRFAILDGNVDKDVPSFPLELNLRNNQNVRQNVRLIKVPKVEFESSFNLQKFSSVLLPNENKLLEPSALLKCRHMMLNTTPVELARYLTSVDLDLLKVINKDDLGVCVISGLELITLPQGKLLRQDVLERMYCLKAFVMVTILTCPKVSDRSAMVSQWIQVAMETKTVMGNLFGFETIMEGLNSEQISRLRDTWMVLRQNHTSSAFMFDTKLKTVARALQDGSGSLPVQNISIPSISPMVLLMERGQDDQSYFPWELSDNINFGLDIMLVHLDMARVITAQCGVYCVTGETILKDLRLDNERLEMFRTEFHMRFLWGSKGAGVERKERQSKFNMLLSAYSEKIEPEGDVGTEL